MAPDWRLITWRSVGLDVAVHEPGLPFFIQWEMGSPCPEPPRSTTPAVRRGSTSLSVAADQERLADWLGDHDLPIAATGRTGTSVITLTRGPDDFTLE